MRTRIAVCGLFAFPSLLGFSAAAAYAAAAPEQQSGKQDYLLRADAAWTDAASRIAPAYVLVQKGEIRSVTAFEPRVPGVETIQVKGTLAPGVVDAWAGLLPGDLAFSERAAVAARAADSLPADLPGADPELAARVREARSMGVVALYVGGAGSQVAQGLGTAAVFSANDLLLAAGEQFLDFSLPGTWSSDAESYLQVDQIFELFDSAAEYRKAKDEYQEKLEKYQKDLEEYRKKFEEYAANKAKDEGKAKEQGQEAGKGPGQEQQQGGGSGGGRGNGKEDQKGADKEAKDQKEEKAPKRPERPAEPLATPGQLLALRAMDGELKVRVVAQRAYDLRRVLELRDKHDLDLLLVGAEEADLIAAEIAAAEVPVVLSLAPSQDWPAAERGLARRYRALLEAEVEVALASGGALSPAMMWARAGELVAAGADPAQVFASLTSVPAKLLGLEETHGKLERGATLDFFLFGGSSPFDASAPLRAHRPGSGFGS